MIPFKLLDLAIPDATLLQPFQLCEPINLLCPLNCGNPQIHLQMKEF